MQNTYKLCNLVIKGEKHREDMNLGKTKKTEELTTIETAMMTDLYLSYFSPGSFLLDVFSFTN